MTSFKEVATRESCFRPGSTLCPGCGELVIERDGSRYLCRLSNGPHVNRHRPSVDVMFRSVAQNVGPNAIGVILTGMGADGAEGLKEMREVGSITIAQDEKTSIVFSMPHHAIKLGAAQYVLPVHEIAALLVGKVFANNKEA